MKQHWLKSEFFVWHTCRTFFKNWINTARYKDKFTSSKNGRDKKANKFFDHNFVSFGFALEVSSVKVHLNFLSFYPYPTKNCLKSPRRCFLMFLEVCGSRSVNIENIVKIQGFVLLPTVPPPPWELHKQSPTKQDQVKTFDKAVFFTFAQLHFAINHNLFLCKFVDFSLESLCYEAYILKAQKSAESAFQSQKIRGKIA